MTTEREARLQTLLDAANRTIVMRDQHIVDLQHTLGQPMEGEVKMLTERLAMTRMLLDAANQRIAELEQERYGSPYCIDGCVAEGNEGRRLAKLRAETAPPAPPTIAQGK